MALTATATEKFRCAILKSLAMPDAVTLHIKPDRPNLTYNVVDVQGDWDSDLNLNLLFSNYISVLTDPTGPACPKVIVYCSTISTVSLVFSFFCKFVHHPRSRLCPVAMYHHNTAPSNKLHVSSEFPKPDSVVRVVICTIAFGLRIDFPDIHCVIYFGIPLVSTNFSMLQLHLFTGIIILF